MQQPSLALWRCPTGKGQEKPSILRVWASSCLTHLSKWFGRNLRPVTTKGYYFKYLDKWQLFRGKTWSQRMLTPKLQVIKRYNQTFVLIELLFVYSHTQLLFAIRSSTLFILIGLLQIQETGSHQHWYSPNRKSILNDLSNSLLNTNFTGQWGLWESWYLILKWVRRQGTMVTYPQWPLSD